MKDRQFGRLRFICGDNKGKYPYNHSVYIKTGAARIIIDPACSLAKLTALRDDEGVDMVWLSHWHEDHIHYMHMFNGAQVWVSETDFPPLTNIETFLDWYGMDDAQIRAYWDEIMRKEFNYQPLKSANFFPLDTQTDIGGVRVEAIATPGHTPGSLCYLVNGRWLFTGDTISLTLNAQSAEALSRLDLLLNFDPTVLRAIDATEGNFLRQNNAQTTFSKAIDQAGGQVLVDIAGTGPDGASGSGSAVTLSFEAIAEHPQTQITVGRAAPSAPGGGDLTATVPVPHAIAVTP